jgi:hypothetical protein
MLPNVNNYWALGKLMTRFSLFKAAWWPVWVLLNMVSQWLDIWLDIFGIGFIYVCIYI